VPETRRAGLFFHFAKRTNQAEGCYQNFRLCDKLNYGGNSEAGGRADGRAGACTAEKLRRGGKN